MKEGDRLIEQLKKAFEEHERLFGWLRTVSSLEYTPDWIYWFEFVKLNKN